ncbi:MAG: phospholipase D family protein [Pseudomonadota bacterium]
MSPSLRCFAVAAFGLFISACSSLPENVEREASYQLEASSDTRIATSTAKLIAANPDKSGFFLLPDGLEALVARMRMISSADQTLDVQYYIWHWDDVGKLMYYALLQAADRGVRVRILLDDMDTAGKDDILRLVDAHPQVEIRLFNPFANRDRRVADFVGDTARVNRRMHNKTLTADNLITVFGGRNIGNEYFDAAQDVGFNDMDVVAVGGVAADVSTSFDLYWNSVEAYPLRAFYPGEYPEAADVEALRQELNDFARAARESEYAAALSKTSLAYIKALAGERLVWSDWLLAYDTPEKVRLDKVTEATHLAPKLLKGFERTDNELIIVSPYFVPGRELTDYLVGMVERGVEVRILTNSLAANDVPLVHSGYMRYRKDLVAGGVELYEFKTRKDEAIERSWKGASRASLHGKFFSFDQSYLFIGSFNLDGRSVALNTELGGYFESPAHASMLSQAFDEQGVKRAYRVTLDERGDLRWTTMDNGEEVTFDKEPDTSWWMRTNVKLFSWFVPEKQL